MKGMILLVCCLVAFSGFLNAHASLIGTPAPSTYLQKCKDLKAGAFIQLSAKDLCAISGKKLSLGEKAAFSVMKIKMKRAIRNNPDLTVKEYLTRPKDIFRGWMIAILLVVAILITVLMLSVRVV